MQTPYFINRQTVTPESAEAGEYHDCCLEESGTSSVKDTIMRAVHAYGVVALGSGIVCNWFASVSPTEDREFFESGVEKYYTLHFPLLTGRALLRVNQMLAIAWKEKPQCLK